MSFLQEAVAGKVVQRSDSNYDRVRQSLVWNGSVPDRKPDVIVHAESDRDVVAAVRHARANGMKVAVRGSGHSWCASSMRDGGVLIDLSAMNEVSVDPASRTASVQPGLLNEDLVRALAPHGLAFPCGHCPDVAVSGYLLGGGFGWNAGQWGVACFSVRQVEVVTAAGELVIANERENPDIFWAARGAGPGFFGVVTRYELNVFPAPGAMQAATRVFPLGRTADVVRWASETVSTLSAPIDLTIILCRAHLPGVEEPPLVCVVSGVAFADTDAAAVRALEPLANCPIPDAMMADGPKPVTYDDLYAEMSRFFVKGMRAASDTFWYAGDPVSIIGGLSERMPCAEAGDPLVLGLVLPPPPPNAPPMPDVAFSMIGPVYTGLHVAWRDEKDDAANQAWMAEAVAAVEPLSIGHYLGEADLSKPSRARRCFGAAQWERLQQLKQVHDPDNLFHTFLCAEG